MTRMKALALALAMLAVPLQGLAQGFPARQVRVVVPYPPGGSIDILARALAPELSQAWGQPVVVENIAGAGSIIGAEKVATAAPDGHTLLMTVNATVVGNRFLFKKLPYDPDRSFAPVTMVAQSGQFILAHPSLAAKNLRELVEQARREPGKLAYGSFGLGTQPQLLFETMAKREGIQFLHVPYKGIAPTMTAVIAGEVLLSTASPAQSGALVRAGKLRALAIGSATRSGAFPDVPTSAEAGYPYALASIWFAMFAPGGTPPALVDRIQKDVATVARKPDFTEKQITSRGMDLVASTPADFAAAIKAEIELTAEMVKAAGVTPE